jgi:hypothetical protein
MSSEGELIKATVEAALAPFTDLMRQIGGPAAQELGLAWQDSLKVWRFKRRIRLLEKLQQYISEKGINPKVVSMKLLLPAIEYGSLEDCDELQDRWAALLTTAATSEDELPSAFSEILKQLSTREVRLLDSIHRELESSVPAPDIDLELDARRVGTFGRVAALYAKANRLAPPVVSFGTFEWAPDLFVQFGISLGNVTRLGLLATDVNARPHRLRTLTNDAETDYFVTALGRAFIVACQPPHKAAVEG